MPELPEVSLMTEHLKDFQNCRLQKIIPISGRYTKKPIPSFMSSKILYIRNKGKFIWILLDNDITIWITLGLTGELSKKPDTAFARLKFQTNCGAWYLNDKRNFGTVTIKNKNALRNKLKQLGPDPLHESFTFKEFQEQYKKEPQKQKIGDALLKQTFIAGIGNYLRAEILYQSKVSPYCQLSKIPLKYWKKIHKSTKKIILQSYIHQKKNGLHTFPFKVYQKRFDPKGHSVLGESFKGKRTMWWVPTQVLLKCKKN